MASKEQIVQRRNLLLECLEQNDVVMLEELQEKLNAGKRTVLDDIQKLRMTGNIIEINRNQVTLMKKTDVIEHSSKAVMRRIHLLYKINKKGSTKKELLKEILSEEECDLEIEEEKKRIDRKRKNLEHDLKELQRQKMIILDKNKYFVNISIQLSENINDHFMIEIYNAIVNNGDGTAYSDILNHIAQKLAEAMRYKLYEEPKEYVASIVLGANSKKDEKYEKNLKDLFNIPYKTHQIKIVFYNRNGKVSEQILAVGKLVYLCDRGKSYIIGEEVNKELISIMDVSRIISIEVLEDINEKYNAPEFQKICEEMLLISIEQPQHIKVEFDNVYEIREEIKKLHENRTESKIEIKDNVIIYYDVVRGMNDLAKFFRKYGNSCRVIEPKVLQRKMYDSACRLLERYGENEGLS